MHVSEMMTPLIRKNANDHIDLPSYNVLPLSMQCIPVDELNTLIKEVARKEFSKKVIGVYPDEPVVLRK